MVERLFEKKIKIGRGKVKKRKIRISQRNFNN